VDFTFLEGPFEYKIKEIKIYVALNSKEIK